MVAEIRRLPTNLGDLVGMYLPDLISSQYSGGLTIKVKIANSMSG